MSYSNPTRYDLDPGDALGAEDFVPGSMNPHPHGDYVTYSDYEDLLQAYEVRGKLLREIGGLAENA